MRSLLVLLAYVLGVAALVGAMGPTQATTGRIVSRLTDAGSTRLRVVDSAAAAQPWTVADPTAQGAWTAAEAAASRLSELEGVLVAAPVRTFTAVSNSVTRLRPDGTPGRATQGRTFQGHLMVTEERFLSAHNLTIASGRSDVLESSWPGQVVVVGAAAATSLGIADASPGVVLWLNGRPVDVAGVLAPSGDLTYDDSLYFSPATLAYLSDQLDSYWFVRADDGYAEPLAAALRLALAPENPGRISVSAVAQLAKLQQGINADLGTLLGVIGGVTLVLSALTAGTTMFLSVQHRAGEIALRRAMGSSRAAIWRLFTYEGMAIGVAGGILGTGGGTLLAWLVAQANGWPLCLGPAMVVAGVGVGLVAGIAASVVPALHAARRDPAGILRAT